MVCGFWKPTCQEDSEFNQAHFSKPEPKSRLKVNLNLFTTPFSFSESLTTIFLSIVYTRAAAACGDASIRWPIVSNISSPDSISGYLNEGGRVGAQEIVMNEILT